MRRPPSIAAILLVMTVTALLLPLSGLWLLRLYDSTLVRQTESELISQGAMIAATYRQAWQSAGGDPEAAGLPVDPRWARPEDTDGPWMPRFPTLDLARDPILAAPPDPEPSDRSASEAARKAGRFLTPILREAQRTTLAAMRVVDVHGTVVASTNEAFGVSFAPRDEFRRVVRGEPVSVLRKWGAGEPTSGLGIWGRHSQVRVYVAMPVLDNDRVVAAVLLSRTPMAITDALYDVRWHLAGLAAVILGLVAALVGLGTVAIARPLRAVTRQAKQTAEGTRGAMVPLARPMVGEVAELSEALVRMAATLEQRADYIRTFAAHVSHEFKSPLTTIQGTVELLRDESDGMPAETRRNFLGRLETESLRLARLVRGLLELARADVLQPEQGGGAPLRGILGRLAQDPRFRDLTIQFADVPDAEVAMGEEALRTVLSQLFDNSLRYAGPGTTVRVELEVSADGDMVTLSDDGPGISPANAEKVFTPFFTTGREAGGSGLGLAIVQRLVAAHGGRVEAGSGGTGATIRFFLPRTPARNLHRISA